jgi:hypothetical protein
MHGEDLPRSEETGGAPFLSGGGETGHLVRHLDWSTTPLGPASGWKQSLRTAFDICLNSRFPIALYWGPEYVMLYNDNLLPMVGANKHPQAMGRPAFEVLPEIRGIIEPLLDHVRNTGEATWSEDLMLPLVRGAGAEESYFTFTYSPIHDEAGAVGGVFCAVIETTEKVIEERRLRLLNALAQATQARTQEDAVAHAAAQIAQFQTTCPSRSFTSWMRAKAPDARRAWPAYPASLRERGTRRRRSRCPTTPFGRWRERWEATLPWSWT